jgi:hypothetical protein
VDQGTGSHIVGNVFWYIACVKRVFGGTTNEERIAFLQADLNKWYKRTKATSRIQGELTIDRIRTSKSWPKLKAKAAATRHAAAYALELMLTHASTDEADPWYQADQMAIGVCQLLVQFYAMLQFESRYLSAAATAAAPELGRKLSILYGRLSTFAFNMGIKLWKVMPKLHLVIHLCEDQMPVFGNARYYWTYGDEDLVGHLIEIAESVHPRTVAISLLMKWLICVFDE